MAENSPYWVINDRGNIVPDYSQQTQDQIFKGWVNSMSGGIPSGAMPNFWGLFNKLDQAKDAPSKDKTDPKSTSNKTTPQWTFKPNPNDQPSYGMAGVPQGNMANLPASQWASVLNTQPWMLNPAGQQPGNPQQAQGPQQPVMPDQGYGYYNQWALNPFAGY